MTKEGKDGLDKRYAEKLAEWRLTPEHQGFYTIGTEEWASSTPEEIMQSFEDDNLQAASSRLSETFGRFCSLTSITSVHTSLTCI